MQLKILMSCVYLVCLGGFSQFALAQSVETATELLQREGRYVSITLQLGEPLKIFVTGKERARISLDEMKMEIRTTGRKGWEELKVNKYGNYYSASVGPGSQQDNSLEVRTTLKNKKPESFKFKLK